MIMSWLRRALGPGGSPVQAGSRPQHAGFATRSWRSSDGLELQARDYPPADGPARLPVICLHGLTRNAADFETVAPWIAARGRRVLVVDFRGRGGSAWDPQPMNYLPPAYAADVLALMDAAGIARALFVGTSLGGIVTMVLSSLRPAAVAGAVLNDVGPSLNPEALRRIGAYTGEDPKVADWAQAAAYARKINGEAFPAYGPAQWDAFARRLFKEGPDGRPRLNYDPDIMAPIRAAGPNALAPDITPLFIALAANRPLLLVRGGASDLLDGLRLSQMRALAPAMDYAEVPGVGHAPMLDEPEARGAMAAFLDTAP